MVENDSPRVSVILFLHLIFRVDAFPLDLDYKTKRTPLNSSINLEIFFGPLLRKARKNSRLVFFNYLLALLLCLHRLFISGLKLSNKVMFSIGVPVPNCTLLQTQTNALS